MTLFILWGLALVATAFTAGRVYERIAADRRTDQKAEEDRIQRPLVTVADGGWLDPEPADLLALTREVLLDEEPRGRHDHRVAIGTRAQRARWNLDTHAFHILVGGTWSAQERAELELAT